MSPARTRGHKINLSDLAGDPDLEDGRRHGSAAATEGGSLSLPLTQLALNPFNKRVLDARPEALAELGESMRANGQLQPCAVVSRAAFRRAFPEEDGALGAAAFVHVTGARRHMAARHLHWEKLDVVVRDELAISPLRFLSATAAENLDRQDFDPVEEAEQVQLVVAAAGSGQEAATQLRRSPGWVSQRLNLLKLIPEVQAALRAGEFPIREARSLHTASPAEQLAALRRFADPEPPSETSPTGTNSRPAVQRDPRVGIVRAIRRLGATPEAIAINLRAGLADDDLAHLVRHLTAPAQVAHSPEAS